MSCLKVSNRIDMYYPTFIKGVRKNKKAFLIGMARILDITSSLSANKTIVFDEPDFNDFYDIYSDWAKTGDDIESAINSFHWPTESDARSK